MTTYLIAAALSLVLVLTVQARTYWLFAAYLAAELLKMLAYEPGVSWYVWVEPVVLTLRAAAALEAWLWLATNLDYREWRRLAWVSVAGGVVVTAITLATWPLGEAVSILNQARLSIHMLCGGALLTASMWLTLFPIRGVPGALRHAWTMTATLWVFAAAGLYRAETMEQWVTFRQRWNVALLLCLLIWIQQQLAEFRNLRLKMHNSRLH